MVDKIMLNDKTTFTGVLSLPKEQSIIFNVSNYDEILKLEANGDILVKGKLIENDKQVVDALREFIRGNKQCLKRKQQTNKCG